jgi:hypothetical protein
MKELELYLEYKDLGFNLIMDPEVTIKQQISELFENERISNCIEWDKIKIIGVEINK